MMPYDYEMPPWPSCPSCDGRGWYVEGGKDRRCQCWLYEMVLNGPPEAPIPPWDMR